MEHYPKLNKNLKADVVIIGGGLAGIIFAYLVSKSGKKVIVLEKNTIGSGATQYTTAFITQVIDTSYGDLIHTIGQDKASMVADSHAKAIDLIEKMVKEENIDCNFTRCTNFLYANSPQEFNKLSKEADGMKAAGLQATLERKDSNLGFANSGFVKVKNQAKFSAKKFISSLAEICAKNGVMIFENSQAAKIESNGNTVKVQAGSYAVKAHYGIVATYEPFNKPLSLYFKKGFYTTYVISATIPKGIVKEAIYEDSQSPYHYFRIDADQNNDIITIGGEDHRTLLKVSAKKSFLALEDYLKTILPNMSYKITAKWKGPILEPADGLPSIGQLGKENIFYAMAFSGNGMTYSAIAAQIFTDEIMNKKNDWLDVYSANRIPNLASLFVKARDYIQVLEGGAIKNTFGKE